MVSDIRPKETCIVIMSTIVPGPYINWIATTYGTIVGRLNLQVLALLFPLLFLLCNILMGGILSKELLYDMRHNWNEA